MKDDPAHSASAQTLERDLEAWILEFVAREPPQQFGSPGRDGGTTNLLMGLLGGWLLQHETLAVYCEERGHAAALFRDDVKGDANAFPFAFERHRPVPEIGRE